MSKARTLADFISDGSEFADGTISVAEVSGAAPLASPTFTGTASGTFSGPLTGDVVGNLTGDVTGDVTGALTGDVTAPEIDLTAISSTIADTAVDVFVYDTRKDSDGGAWRKRTQHTSWYNETLNTATRGSRKEFPAVAVIVAESTTTTIYDGDDPDLPMWMVFNRAGDSYFASSSTLCTSVVFFNGLLVFGVGTGTREISFLKDSALFRTNSGKNKLSQPISGRNSGNAGLGYDGDPLVNSSVNDIAMTVLPNAPIDAATGLPVPTIAVATDGGVSVIRDDGNVSNVTPGGGVVMTSCDFDLDYNLVLGRNSFVLMRSDYPRYLSNQTDSDYAINNRKTSTPSVGEDSTSLSTLRNVVGISSSFVAYDTETLGLGLYSKSNNNSSSMVAKVTSSYNTGWMHGDIKLATLSDTDDTNVTGAELVTNGTFDSDVSGWSAVDGTIAYSSGQALVTRTGGSGNVAYQDITTVVGSVYVLSGTTISTGTGDKVDLRAFDGSTMLANAAGIDNQTVQSSATFTATSTTTRIWAVLDNSGTATIDNVSVRLAEEDRSVNGNGLQVFGTVTKSAVATGADLVAYSGWSGSNYLRQPYNPDLNFGTGEWSVHCWFKIASGVNTAVMLSWRNSGGAAPYWQIYQTNTSMSFDASDGVINAGLSTSTTFRDDQWHKLTFLARGPSLREAYVDGKFIGSSTTTVGTGFTGGSDHEFKVGQHYDGAYPYTGSVALVRISATAPSPEQIKKIYNDEKVLFQENAKATLYGSSDAVTALAYDDSTDLLHVGTSAGRSVFQGLRRVDNTTDAVGAAISASNGLVAED